MLGEYSIVREPLRPIKIPHCPMKKPLNPTREPFKLTALFFNNYLSLEYSSRNDFPSKNIL